MNVKIDTKEKFTVITPNQTDFTAIMTDELLNTLLQYKKSAQPHVVLNMINVATINKDDATRITVAHHEFHEKNYSFVICCLRKNVEAKLKEWELLEYLNYAPTESEAWDIIQMEEIERELLKDME